MNPELRDLLATFGATVGASLDADQLDRLARYVQLLQLWNRTTRLTGPSDERTLVCRHLADSLAVAPRIPAAGTFVDVGSGAGLPGVVMAIARPDASGFLVEARRRRVSFLGEVVRTVDLGRITTLCARAEELSDDPRLANACDLAVSRAVRADAFLALARPFVRAGGLAVAMQTEAQANAGAVHMSGFELEEHFDYVLPDSSPRRLLLYRRVC